MTAQSLLVLCRDLMFGRAHCPNRNLVFCCTCESLPKYMGCDPQFANTVVFSTDLGCTELLQPQVIAGIK